MTQGEPTVEKIWLDSYPEGIPAEINPDRYASIAELFKEACTQFADRVAFSNMGRIMTYQQFLEKSRAFASYLQNDLGHQRGDRIAIMLPNTMQYPVSMFGAMLAGCTVVNVNPLYTPRELSHQLNDAGVKTIVIVANFAKTLESCIAETPVENVIVTEIGDLFASLKGSIVDSRVPVDCKEPSRASSLRANVFSSSGERPIKCIWTNTFFLRERIQ